MPDREPYLREVVASMGLGSPLNRHEARSLMARAKKLARRNQFLAMLKAARGELKTREKNPLSSRVRSQFRIA